ncbi:hypothetical protein DFLDMN_001043 [Cupriavidus sp. H19C3]|uniref:hypothetical protein n=1 Tax=Cupriavidus sp. H19C3 TaxID=3241603 RepID=UPI003BF8F1CF
MGTLSKEQITAIDYELASPFGRVVLACDGYTITVSVEAKGPRKYVLMVYVNGWFKGEWMKGACEEATRFLRPVPYELYKPAQKAEILRDLGKREGTKFLAKYNRTGVIYEPNWQSVRSMLKHFCKHNELVSVTSIGFQSASEKTKADTSAAALAPVL